MTIAQFKFKSSQIKLPYIFQNSMPQQNMYPMTQCTIRQFAINDYCWKLSIIVQTCLACIVRIILVDIQPYSLYIHLRLHGITSVFVHRTRCSVCIFLYQRHHRNAGRIKLFNLLFAILFQSILFKVHTQHEIIFLHLFYISTSYFLIVLYLLLKLCIFFDC